MLVTFFSYKYTREIKYNSLSLNLYTTAVLLHIKVHGAH